MENHMSYGENELSLSRRKPAELYRGGTRRSDFAKATTDKRGARGAGG